VAVVGRFDGRYRTAGKLLELAFSAVLVAFPALALAQAAPIAPPSRSEIERAPATRSQPRARLTVEGGVERAPCALDDPAYQAIRIKLTAANFKHLDPVPAAEMKASYAEFIGTDQPISVVCRIRDAAATRLRALGYVAAVQVPAQRIENGVVDFEVLFARLTQVRVVGTPGRSEKVVQAYLSRLADGQLFNRYRAERFLLLARDLPGYEVRLALKPAGTGPGEMIGEVWVNYIPVLLDFSLQDYAAPSTGRFDGQLRAVFNGLTGMGDRTTLALSSTVQPKKQQVLQLGHEMALGGEGLRLGTRFTYAWTQPDLGPTVPDVQVRTLLAGLDLSYPLVRSQQLTLKGTAGLDYVNQRVRLAGLPLSEDRLRTIFARLDLEAIDLAGTGPDGTVGWKLTASIEGRKGLSVLSASPDCVTQHAYCVTPGVVTPSLPTGDPQAALLRFSAALEMHPLSHWVLAVSPRAQLASGSLFAFERISGGNYTIGRGFDPGALSGDDGIGFQTELRYESLVLSAKRQIDARPYVFADNLWLWDRSAANPQPQLLSTVGGGMRIGIGSRARLDLAGAAPMVRLPGEVMRRDPRFLMTLAMNLYPWSAQ